MTSTARYVPFPATGTGLRTHPFCHFRACSGRGRVRENMTSQLRKIHSVIEQFLLPMAEAVSGWPTLAAIRSALIVTLPLMFLGSLAELLISFPLDAYRDFMFRQFGPEWRMFGQILKDATFSVMSSSWFFP